MGNGRNQCKAQFLAPLLRDDGLVRVAQAMSEIVFPIGIAPTQSIGHADRIKRDAEGNAVVRVLAQCAPFQRTFEGLLVGASRDAKAEAICNPVIKCHSHARIVQAPERVNSLVDLSKPMGNNKVKNVGTRRLIALHIDDSGVLKS